MFGFIRVVVFLSVIVSIDCYLTKECADATNNCMASLTQDLFNGTGFCSAMQQYFPCVANELTTAETTVTCDKLSILFKKVTELRTLNDLVTSESCDISTPPGLELDECSREIAKCGLLAVKASVASNKKTKCSEIENFIACMAAETLSCEDFDLVNSLVSEEISHELYQSDCFDEASVTTASTGTSVTPGTQPTTQVFTGTTRSPIPTMQSWIITEGRPTTGVTTTLTTMRPSSGSQGSSSVTQDDLKALRIDFQKSLDLQTTAIVQTLKEHIQGLQNKLPSKLLLNNQLTDILTRTANLETTLKAEFRSHSERLEQILQNLINDLAQVINRVEPISSQTNSVHSDATASLKRKTPTSMSCVEKVMNVLGDIYPSESWSAEHYVKVSHLGVRGGMSGPQSVVVMFSRAEDRLVAFVKGKDAFEQQQITMEMIPSYFKFTCAA
ncbi:uncharacterized protein [Littorina saxatilis]|uniref:Uncharacterized protein n=1 Tax=Littorina saxatilis TaxID=31220 RepID=A0AAN9ASA3_9CAEN